MIISYFKNKNHLQPNNIPSGHSLIQPAKVQLLRQILLFNQIKIVNDRLTILQEFQWLNFQQFGNYLCQTMNFWCKPKLDKVCHNFCFDAIFCINMVCFFIVPHALSPVVIQSVGNLITEWRSGSCLNGFCGQAVRVISKSLTHLKCFR